MVLGVVRGWCCVVGAGGVVQVFVEGREHVGYLLAGGVLGPVASVHLCDQCPLSSRFDGTNAFDTFVLLQDSAYLLSSVAALLLSDAFRIALLIVRRPTVSALGMPLRLFTRWAMMSPRLLSGLSFLLASVVVVDGCVSL